MKKFLLNTFHFALIGGFPLLILLLLYLVLDPFKVIYSYASFYDTTAKGWVGINKDYVSTTTYINNCKKSNINYNSFILGNSRSIFYHVSDWRKYLSPNSECFHFDASGETLWALNKKIEYLDKKGVEIENVLLVLDYTILIQDKPKSGHLFLISPVIVNNRNIFDFHKASFMAFLSPKFLYAFIDFQISGVVKSYMKESNLLDDRPLNYDQSSNEIRYDYFEDMISKNEYYTHERLSLFYKRDTIQKYSPLAIKENQKVILCNIRNIFKKHHTKVTVVISPLYDQEKLNKIDLSNLKNIFGDNNVFDFSGINNLTNDYKNYYEPSHYRPHVASEVMKLIYKRE